MTAVVAGVQSTASSEDGHPRVEVGGAYVEFHPGDPGAPEKPLLNHLAVLVDSADEHPEAAEELNALAQELGTGGRVWVGGGEAIKYRDQLHQLNWILIRDLDDLDDRLRR